MGIYLDGEIVTALSDIESSAGGNFKPRGLNIELGYALPNMPIEITGKFEQFSEDGNNSTNRLGAVVSSSLFNETAVLALEFLHTDNGDTTENSIVSQLAIEF